MTGLQWEHEIPWVAGLGLLLLYGVPALLLMPGGSRKALALCAALESITILCLLLAWASPVVPEPVSSPLSVTFLLDVSDSIRPAEHAAFIARMNGIAAGLGPEDRVRLIVFGRDGREVRAADGPARFTPQAYGVDGDRTNLASALRMAVFRPERDRQHRIVLLSDGNENVESAADVLPLVVRARAALFAYGPTEERTGSSERPGLNRVSVPVQAGSDERFHIHVFAENPTGESVSGVLRVRFDGEPIAEERVVLPPGVSPFRLVHHEAQTGIHVVEGGLAVDGGGQAAVPVAGFVHVIGKPRVLVVDRDEARREFLVGLLGKDFSAVGRHALPQDFQEWLRYECLILNDVRVAELRGAPMEDLATFVQETGGGLIVVGGDDENGMTAYRGTRLEDVLPVRLDIRKAKDRRDFALLLLIDRSGSMQGEKIEMAVRAANKAVDNLKPGDVIGVLAFDVQPQWLVRPVTLEEDPRPIQDLVRSVHADGGTDVRLALAEAFRELLERRMNIRCHVVVISDGITPAEGLIPLVRKMAESGITLSTVAIGGESNLPLMKALKENGRGEFYHVSDIEVLPNIVVKDIEESLKTVNVIRTDFRPRLHEPHPITKGIDAASLPVLMSYSLSELKPSAQKPLTTSFRNTDDPILATWLYGLGKSSVVLSGLRTGWLGSGTDWGQFGTLWSQLVRWTARSDSLDHPLIKLRLSGDRVRLRLRIPPAGEWITDVEARLVSPGTPGTSIPLERKGPYFYEGEFPVREASAPGLVLQGRRENESWVRSYPIRLPGPLPVPPRSLESPHDPPNTALLERLARETRGGFMSDPAEVLQRHEPATVSRPYWPGLVVLALFFFLMEIAVRRLVRL